MAAIILAGLQGTLVEQTAAAVGSRLGCSIEPAAALAASSTNEGKAGVYLGWGALSAAETRPRLCVLLTASWDVRLRRIAAEQGVEEAEAAGIAAIEERAADQEARRLGWSTAMDPARFDLVINTDRFTPERAAMLISQAAAQTPSRRHRRRRRSVRPGLPAAAPQVTEKAGRPAQGQVEPSTAAPVTPAALPIVGPAQDGAPAPVHHPLPAGAKPAFAHPSEEEFARVLDFYRVRWLYEPTTFPLEWDERGNVTLAFTPDFYLPDWKLYVELTTMKQNLVTRKNRKIRRLKELYSAVNIKAFYGRDFERLLRKFGKEQAEPAGQAAVGAGGKPATGGAPAVLPPAVAATTAAAPVVPVAPPAETPTQARPEPPREPAGEAVATAPHPGRARRRPARGGRRPRLRTRSADGATAGTARSPVAGVSEAAVKEDA